MKSGNLGMILSVFLIVIMGYAFVTIAADNIHQQVTLADATNYTITTPSAGNGTLLIPGKQNTTAISVINTADGTDDWSDEFEAVVVDNQLYLKITDAGVTAGHNGTSANLTYTYQPTQYLVHGTGRTLIALILIFMAVGILLYIVAPIIQNLYKTVGRN